MKITLKEYAEKHGINPATARQKAGRGGYKTAEKIGRDWFIDEDEPYVDLRTKNGVQFPNFDQTLSSAREYHAAFTKLNTDELITISNQSYSTVPPSLMVCVFACELYLKSLLLGEGKTSYGQTHYLDDLFDSLNNSTQGGIYLQMDAFGFTNPTVKKGLSDYRNLFTNIRYYHEYESLPVPQEFIIKLLSALSTSASHFEKSPS